MTMQALAIMLLASFLGMALAAVVASLPNRHAHRLSNLIVAVCALMGAVVGIFIATATEPLILPSASLWPVFYGMNFSLDRFSAIFYTLVSGISFFAAAYAIPYLEQQPDNYNIRNVNILTAVFIFGMQGVILSTNIFGFMTFWEIMSITLFFLILADGKAVSRKAGFLYLILAHLSTSAIMAGLFLLSGGALLNNFSVLAQMTADLPQVSLFVAIGLLIFGFGCKAGLVPFHVWLPEVHSQVPTQVSALLSGAMLNIAVYGFLRVFLFLLPGVPMWAVFTVFFLGLLSAVVGVLYSVLERDITRLLAYTSIQNFGIMFTMLGLALLAGQEGNLVLAQAAVYAAIFLMLAQAVCQSGLFLASGVLVAAARSRRLEAMGGLAKRMPQLSVGVFMLILGAAFLPPFAPFIADWIFVQAMVGSLEESSLRLKIMILVTVSTITFVTGLAVFAMVKLYAMAFLAQARSEPAAAAMQPGLEFLLPITSLSGLGLMLGLFAPQVLNGIGAVGLAPANFSQQILVTGGGSLVPMDLALFMLVVVFGLWLIRVLISDVKLTREYQTWDGGQPLTPRMEFTSTAFSAPIRFLFSFFLRTKKLVNVTPVTTHNRWIVARSMTLLISQVWYDRLYVPIGAGFTRLASLVVRLQSGNLQAYISLILLATVLTLMIAL